MKNKEGEKRKARKKMVTREHNGKTERTACRKKGEKACM